MIYKENWKLFGRGSVGKDIAETIIPKDLNPFEESNMAETAKTLGKVSDVVPHLIENLPNPFTAIKDGMWELIKPLVYGFLAFIVVIIVVRVLLSKVLFG